MDLTQNAYFVWEKQKSHKKIIKKIKFFIWENNLVLDDWMHKLPSDKPIFDRYFYQKVYLTKKDIKNFKKYISNKSYEQKNLDLKFCELALEKINDSYQIFYTSFS